MEKTNRKDWVLYRFVTVLSFISIGVASFIAVMSALKGPYHMLAGMLIALSIAILSVSWIYLFYRHKNALDDYSERIARGESPDSEAVLADRKKFINNVPTMTFVIVFAIAVSIMISSVLLLHHARDLGIGWNGKSTHDGDERPVVTVTSTAENDSETSTPYGTYGQGNANEQEPTQAETGTAEDDIEKETGEPTAPATVDLEESTPTTTDNIRTPLSRRNFSKTTENSEETVYLPPEGITDIPTTSNSDNSGYTPEDTQPVNPQSTQPAEQPAQPPSPNAPSDPLDDAINNLNNLLSPR